MFNGHRPNGCRCANSATAEQGKPPDRSGVRRTGLDTFWTRFGQGVDRVWTGVGQGSDMMQMTDMKQVKSKLEPKGVPHGWTVSGRGLCPRVAGSAARAKPASFEIRVWWSVTQTSGLTPRPSHLAPQPCPPSEPVDRCGRSAGDNIVGWTLSGAMGAANRPAGFKAGAGWVDDGTSLRLVAGEHMTPRFDGREGDA